MLESGLYTRARQGMCKAVGICFDDHSTAADQQQPGREGIHVFVEHQDGSAYQVVLPYTKSGLEQVAYGNAIATSATPKFFVNAMTRIGMRSVMQEKQKGLAPA